MPIQADVQLVDLLRQARDGDREALGALLSSYHNYLSLLARLEIGRRLQGKVDAADLVQETFLEAHRKFALFRGQSELELLAWLRQILVAQVAMLVRRFLGTQARDVRLERHLEHELDQSSHALACCVVAPTSSPSQAALRRERAVLLADALSALSDDYQEVIVLRHLEGLPFAQVAERMGRSEDSVQKLWVRALARLRTLVPEDARG